MSNTSDPFKKLSNIQPKPKLEVTARELHLVEHVAKKQGFAEDKIVPERLLRRNRNKDANPTIMSATMRVEISDWNAFVEWCDAERLTYKDAFKKLIQNSKLV